MHQLFKILQHLQLMFTIAVICGPTQAQTPGVAVGTLIVYAFEDGAPGKNITLQIGSDAYSVDSQGQFSESFQEGEFMLSITYSDNTNKKLQVSIIPNKSTLLVIRKQGQTIHVENETPNALTATHEKIPSTPITRKNSLYGEVISLESGDAIEGVQVIVSGEKVTATTNKVGNFRLTLPLEKATISFIHPNYATLTKKDLTISEHAKEPMIIKMSPAATKLKDVVVTAPHIQGSTASLLDEKRTSSEISEILGADQMAKSGDGNAASALRRVTGLTLLDGKYIFVRGLGERYSATTLNGSQLPSPEPTRRVVPLDIFPAGVLESIVVQKSFSPQMPAEFGGGIVGLRTKKIPDHFFLKLDFSSSWSTERDKTRYNYPGSKRDWSGWDDGNRELPTLIRNSTVRGKIDQGEDFTDEEIEEFGESLPNQYDVAEQSCTLQNAFSFKTACTLPFGLSVSLGDKFQVADTKFGYLISASYSSKSSDLNRRLTRYNASAGVLDNIDKDLDYNGTQDTIHFSSLNTFGLEYNRDHKIGVTTFVTRKTTNKTQLKEGTTGGGDDTIRTTKLEWKERELMFHQVTGDHTILDRFDLNWNYSQADAKTYTPDTREYRYEQFEPESPYALSTRSDGNQRNYSTLNDENEDWSVNLTYRAISTDWIKSKLSLGVSQLTKNRTYEMRRFYFTGFEQLTNWQSIRTLNPESIFTPENIGPNGLRLIEGTRNTDTYKARHWIDSHYAMAHVSLFEVIDASGGLRVEKSDQQVLTFDQHAADSEAVRAKLKTTNKLPGYSLKLKILDNLFFRGSYGKTISRPDFRELSTATYTDDDIDMEVEGYPDLKNAETLNLDSRLEYYPTPNESISFGWFSKKIKKPIERVLLNIAGNDNKVSYRNSKSAENYGYEFELLKKLHFARQLFTLGGNYTRIFSEITLDLSDIANQTTMTSKTRPMQGVSRYTSNLYLTHEYRGLAYTLLYNEIGPRISELGTNSMPDIYEETIKNLDLVASQKLSEHFNIKFKVKNLLRSGRKSTQGSKVISLKQGSRDYSLGVSAKF